MAPTQHPFGGVRYAITKRKNRPQQSKTIGTVSRISGIREQDVVYCTPAHSCILCLESRSNLLLLIIVLLYKLDELFTAYIGESRYVQHTAFVRAFSLKLSLCQHCVRLRRICGVVGGLLHGELRPSQRNHLHFTNRDGRLGASEDYANGAWRCP